MAARSRKPLPRGLADTNVLVYAFCEDSEHHEACRRLRDRALQDRTLWVLTPQVLTEFYRTLTDSRRVSPAIPPEVALRELAKYRSSFDVAYPGERTASVFEELLARHRPKGRKVFDYYLAATALAFDIGALYTYNVTDFARIDGLTVLEPAKSP